MPEATRVCSHMLLGLKIEDGESKLVIPVGETSLTADQTSVFRSWAAAHPDFVATADDIKAGKTAGKVHEVAAGSLVVKPAAPTAPAATKA